MIVKMVLQGLAAAAVIAGAGFAWAAATGSPDLSVAVTTAADTGYLSLPSGHDGHDGHDGEHGEDRDDD